MKKFLSGILTIVMIISLLPMSSFTSSAATVTYDPDAAIAYAKAHYNDGKGKCAEFVSDCLKAGGFTAVYNTYAKNLGRELQEYGTKITCTGWSSNSRLKASMFKSTLSKGDVIIWENVSGATDTGHAMLYSGKTNSEGEILVYAHNNPKDEEAITPSSSASVVYAIHLTSCTHKDNNNKSLFNNVGICTKCTYQYPYDTGLSDSIQGTYRVISGETVAVRTGPYKYCEEKYTLTSGTLYVYGTVQNHYPHTWYKVKYNGNDYYVYDGIEPAPHTHTLSWGYESVHPHKQYKKCSCGYYATTSSTTKKSGCTTCYPTVSYGSTNPDDYEIPERSLVYSSSSSTMTGEDVAWVQSVLYQLGYSIDIDGRYGPNSAATIKEFQSDYGLEVDGHCGPATRAKLLELWNAKKHTHSYSSTYYDTAHPHKEYKKCSCGDIQYTGANNTSWNTTRYDTAHPHKKYRVCSCGYTESTGSYQTVNTCDSCIQESFATRSRYNNRTYDVYMMSTTWAKAKAFCESKGGHLLVATDKAKDENAHIASLITDSNVCWISGSENRYMTAGAATDSNTTANMFICEYDPYTITYDANGGEGELLPRIKAHDETAYLYVDAPTRDGYKFIGWSKDPNATSGSYWYGASYTENSSVTLYAIWKKDSFGEVYDSDNNLYYYSYKLDGVNISRGAATVILYNQEYGSNTMTNEYGCEAAVDATGKVISNVYGVGCEMIPDGGFVLSAHSSLDNVFVKDYVKVENYVYFDSSSETVYVFETQEKMNEFVSCRYGHSSTELIKGQVEPTCIEVGYTLYYCQYCGTEYREDYIDAIGHDYTINDISPTCTEDGYTSYYCNICGDKYNENYVGATGHSYESTVIAPTCSSNGQTVHTCTACGNSYVTDEISPTFNHEYYVYEEKEATTCSPLDTDGYGYEKVKCKNCESTEEYAVLLSHNYVDNICVNCGIAEKYTFNVIVPEPIVGEKIPSYFSPEIEVYPTPIIHEWGCEGKWVVSTDGINFTTTTKGDVFEAGKYYALTVGAGSLHPDDFDFVNGKEYTTFTMNVFSIQGNCEYEPYICYISDKLVCSIHNFVVGEVIAPTTTSQGYTIYTCENCGATENRDFTPVITINGVQNMQITATDKDITVTWDAIEGTTKYNLYVKNEEGETIITRALAADKTSVTLSWPSELEWDKNYVIGIRAKTTKWLDTVYKDAALVVGDRIVDVKTESLGRTIKVDWRAYEGATLYYVYVYEKGAYPTVLTSVGTTTNSATIINAINPEVDYEVRVIATRGVAKMATADALSVDVRLNVFAPDTFSERGITPNKVAVSFDMVRGADKYWTYLTPVDGGETITRASNKAIAAVSGLAPNTTYNVQIQTRIVDADGTAHYSGMSEILGTITTTDWEDAGFTAIATDNGAELTWKAHTNAIRYYICRSANGGKTFKKIATIDDGTVVSYTDANAKNGFVYAIAVQVQDDFVTTRSSLIKSEAIVK